MTRLTELPKGYKFCANDCGTAFKQYKTTDRFCSRTCFLKATKEKRQRLATKRNHYDEPDRAQRAEKLPVSAYLSQARLKATGLELPTQQETKHGSKFGWIEFGERRFYMRSGWERNYARYLEFLKRQNEIKDWDYEPHRFQFPILRGSNSYLPDFQVFEPDGTHYWVEVKGYMTQQARTKLKRMAKYFPDENVQILDADAYRALAKELKNLVPDWE